MFLNQLTAAINPDSIPEVNLMALSLTELVDHIERIHHAYLHTEMPRLVKMASKVAAVHGEQEPHLVQLKDLVVAQVEELIPILTNKATDAIMLKKLGLEVNFLWLVSARLIFKRAKNSSRPFYINKS